MQNWNFILPGCSILCGSGSHDTHLPDSPLPKNKEKVFKESLSFICILVLLCSKTNKIFFFVRLHLLSADKAWSQHQSHSFSDLSVRLSTADDPLTTLMMRLSPKHWRHSWSISGIHGRGGGWIGRGIKEGWGSSLLIIMGGGGGGQLSRGGGGWNRGRGLG